MTEIVATIVGIIAGVVLGHYIPRAITAKERALRTVRHIGWAWEDFDDVVEREADEFRRGLAQFDEELKRRRIYGSNIDLPERAAAQERHFKAIRRRWRATARRVDDLDGSMEWVERWRGYYPDADLVTREAQDRRLQNALSMITRRAGGEARK